MTMLGVPPAEDRRSRALGRLFLLCLIFIAAILAAPGCAPDGAADGSDSDSTTTQPARVLLPVPSDSLDGTRLRTFGFIDENGQWAISPQFEEAGGFYEGLAPVKVAGKWGYVNESGALAVSPQFTEAFGFLGGFARVATGPALPGRNPWWPATGWGFIDSAGTMVIPAEWDDVGFFSDGLAPVMRGTSYGFIDVQGKVVIPLKFEGVCGFSEGLACAAYGGKWGYIDVAGDWVIEPRFAGLSPRGFGVPDSTFGLGVGSFVDGLAPVYVEGDPIQGGVCQYIDKSGDKAFEGVFERAGEFSEGLAPVQVDGVWGFVDVEGNPVVQPQFELSRLHTVEMYLIPDWGGFHEGLAPVVSGGKVGYIDKTGEFVIEPQFDRGGPFCDGFASVFTSRLPPSEQSLISGFSAPQIGDVAVIDRVGRVIYQVAWVPEGTSTTIP
jgi:hypothetical protein